MPTIEQETASPTVERKPVQAEAAAEPAASPRTSRNLASAARAVMHAALRRFDIARFRIMRADAGTIGIGRVALGEATAERVVANGIRSTVRAGRTVLDEVDVVIRLDIRGRWSIDLGWIFRRSRSFSLGTTPAFPFALRDFLIPDIEPVTLTVPEATLSGSSVELRPIDDLVFNGARVDDVLAEDIRLPKAGFALGGLGFRTLDVAHLGALDASVGHVHIGRLAPNGPLTLPRTEIRDIEVPNATAPLAANDAPVAIDSITGSTRAVTLINLGFLRVGIDITPRFDMRINRFSLRDIQADTSIDSIRVENIRTPVAIHDVSLGALDATGPRLEGISL